MFDQFYDCVKEYGGTAGIAIHNKGNGLDTAFCVGASFEALAVSLGAPLEDIKICDQKTKFIATWRAAFRSLRGKQIQEFAAREMGIDRTVIVHAENGSRMKGLTSRVAYRLVTGYQATLALSVFDANKNLVTRISTGQRPAEQAADVQVPASNLA